MSLTNNSVALRICSSRRIKNPQRDDQHKVPEIPPKMAWYIVLNLDNECVMVTTNHFASIITIYHSMSKTNADSNCRKYDANAGEDRRNSTSKFNTRIGAVGGTQTKLDVRICQLGFWS
ncbi:hypothetical protein M378DRAFT_167087 [Amanita muscaria Koide BX008]|uniref:Uncharacterized protein n=1 Tax=Amanita muscaria (strain Koide BX008) TaxID=946122 RepID=A0A0C2WID9_AMAMK|nr:hypothetical protein M378DRAFT_167087 [Amanita muscaria Koide BX008]